MSGLVITTDSTKNANPNMMLIMPRVLLMGIANFQLSRNQRKVTKSEPKGKLKPSASMKESLGFNGNKTPKPKQNIENNKINCINIFIFLELLLPTLRRRDYLDSQFHKQQELLRFDDLGTLFFQYFPQE